MTAPQTETKDLHGILGQEIESRYGKGTGWEVQRELRNRNSHAYLTKVNTQGTELTLFVKFQPEGMQAAPWNVQLEYEGYKAAYELELDETQFFKITPVFYRETPQLLGLEFVQGARPLHEVWKKSLVWLTPGGDFASTLKYAGNTARWIAAFSDAQRAKSARPLALETLSDFIEERYKECFGDAADGRKEYFSRTFPFSALEEQLNKLSSNDLLEMPCHGDLGPHNLLIDPKNRLCVIDVNMLFESHPLYYADSVNFLMYLEEMALNPLYSSDRLRTLSVLFLESLLLSSPEEFRLFRITFVKRMLSHAAFFHNPIRRKQSRFREWVYRRWCNQAMKRIPILLNTDSKENLSEMLYI